MEEVSQHTSVEDLWIVINGRVYDVTEWLVFKIKLLLPKLSFHFRQHSHPGGDAILQDFGGKDATEMFRSVQHSPDAIGIRGNFIIGLLKKKESPPPVKKTAPAKKPTPGPVKKSKL